MLLRSVYYPVELEDDLLDGWLAVTGAQELLEDPGVSERAARKQDGCHAGLLVRLARLLGAGEPAGEQDWGRKRLGQLSGQLVVRLALVLLGGVARVKRDGGHAGVLDQAACNFQPASVAGSQAGAQFHRDRQTAALYGAAGDRDRLVGILEQRRPGSGLDDLL